MLSLFFSLVHRPNFIFLPLPTSSRPLRIRPPSRCPLTLFLTPASHDPNGSPPSSSSPNLFTAGLGYFRALGALGARATQARRH